MELLPIVILSIILGNTEAAPRDLTRLNLDTVDQTHQQVFRPHSEISVRSKRQSNYYDYDYGISSFNYNFGSGFQNSPFFNSLFSQFQRQFEQIANFIRIPGVNSQNPIPIFVPTLYLPSNNCDCYPGNNQGPASNNGRPQVPFVDTFNKDPDVTTPFIRTDFNEPPSTTTMKPISVSNEVSPTTTEGTTTTSVATDVDNNRVGDIDETDDDDEDFGSRPISFEPIRVNNPNIRPPPPVEHGSTQGTSQNP